MTCVYPSLLCTRQLVHGLSCLLFFSVGFFFFYWQCSSMYMGVEKTEIVSYSALGKTHNSYDVAI